jgi:hypothetical protein
MPKEIRPVSDRIARPCSASGFEGGASPTIAWSSSAIAFKRSATAGQSPGRARSAEAGAGNPGRAGEDPGGRTALASLGLLDDALTLDLRRPQDYFQRIWNTGFRAAELARAAEDADAFPGDEPDPADDELEATA